MEITCSWALYFEKVIARHFNFILSQERLGEGRARAENMAKRGGGVVISQGEVAFIQ